jgi:hypothetical protein
MATNGGNTPPTVDKSEKSITGERGLATFFLWLLLALVGSQLWLVDNEPFIGFHSPAWVVRLVGGALALIGIVGTAFIWLSSAKRWRTGDSHLRPWRVECLPVEVREVADAGQKLEAIQLLRSTTGAGLKGARDAIEAYLHRTRDGSA